MIIHFLLRLYSIRNGSRYQRQTDASVGGFLAYIFGRISAYNLQVALAKPTPTIFGRNSHFRPKFSTFCRISAEIHSILGRNSAVLAETPIFGRNCRISVSAEIRPFLGAEFRCRPKRKTLCRSTTSYGRYRVSVSSANRARYEVQVLGSRNNVRCRHLRTSDQTQTVVL